MNQINQAQHGIASGAGGGVAPGDVTLQLAYDNGRTIDVQAANGTVRIRNLAELVALLELVATADQVPLRISMTTPSPPGDQGAIDLTLDDATGGSTPGLWVRSANDSIGTQIVRLTKADNSPWVEFNGKLLIFSDGGDDTDTTEGTFRTGGSRPLKLCTGGGPTGSPGSSAGLIELGMRGDGAGVSDGGFITEPATGRTKFRNYATGATVGDDIMGAVRLPNVGLAGVESTPPAEGDVLLRDTELGPPEVFRTKGFRAYREGAYGLFARMASQSFTDADLTAGVLTVTHDLDFPTPIVQLYDDTGLMVQQAYGASLSAYAVQSTGDDSIDVTFDPVLLPLSGTWTISVLGV
jgi:hypothetical protein